ncbi:MAG: HEAT repeat domain-containing protein [Fimbriiglobus sp.]
MRRLVMLLMAVTVILSSGCASTWDTISSRRFREDPFGVTFKGSDPLATLRNADVQDTDARSRAVRNLKEPIKSGGTQADQDEVMSMLSQEVTQSQSPWMRICAIETLTKFEDPRRIEILANAYHYANGKPAPVTGKSEIQQTSGLLSPELAAMYGTKGFTPDQVSNIRSRAIEGLARSNRVEAVEFLARIAEGKEFGKNEDPTARDYVRQRAVDGLAKLRHNESVVALQKIFAAENGKDLALMSLAHEGLKDLTGKNVAADPDEWQTVLQAGYTVRPEGSGLIKAVGSIIE